MRALKLVKTWISNLLNMVENFLVPESTQLGALLKLEPNLMHRLLPRSPVNIRDTFVLFDYGNKAVKLIVKNIKYKNNQSLRNRIAGYFYEEIMEMVSDITLFGGTEPVLIPMPMSKKEKRGRGFNQCEEICRAIEKLGEGKIKVLYDTLKKIKETARQTTLGRSERILNVKNSMVADPAQIKNKTVLLLDDVYTTGATLEEACRALKLSGGKRVIGLFIAH